jgi:hypothetical protein
MAHKFIRLPVLLVTQLWFVACAQIDQGEPVVDRATLKLANGAAISEAAYDDYSPIVVRLSNGYLALVFGSTRSCALSCTNHNIFVASSVSPYAGDGSLPAFNTPQPLVENGFSPVNGAGRWRLSISVSGNNITIYAQQPGGQIRTSGVINPVSASQINVGAILDVITEYMCYSNNMLGIDATGQMLAANTAGTQVFRFNPNTSASQCMSANVANPKLSTGTHISLMRQTSTGIADAYIASDTAGNASAQTATSNGPQMTALKASLAGHGLVLTGISVFQAATAAGDLLTFSAAPGIGQKSDLYVMKYPTPQVLWSSYVAFGQQPQP